MPKRWNKNTKRSELYSKYLEEIKDEKILTEAEEAELAERIKNKDEDAAIKLMKGNLRFVGPIADQYPKNKGLNSDDLIIEGIIGLQKGICKFKKSFNNKFISYAVWWIRQSIMQALAENGKLVRLPLNKVNNLNKFVVAKNKLIQKNRREPTLSELADELKMDIEGVLGIIDIYKYPVYADSAPKDDDGYSFIDILADEGDKSMVIKKDTVSFKDEVFGILDEMDKVEADVIKYYFGFSGKAMTLDEIGDVLHLTRERVRQIKEKAILNMRNNIKSEGLKKYITKLM